MMRSILGIVWTRLCFTCSSSKGSRTVVRRETRIEVGFNVLARKPALESINAVLRFVH